jgi:hypothetical protein
MTDEFKKIMNRYKEHQTIIKRLSKPKSIAEKLGDMDIDFKKLQYELDYAEQYTMKYDDIAAIRIQNRNHIKDPEKEVKVKRNSYIAALVQEDFKAENTEAQQEDEELKKDIGPSQSTTAITLPRNKKSLSLIPLEGYINETASPIKNLRKRLLI